MSTGAYNIRFENVTPAERFLLDQIVGLFCDPARETLKARFLDSQVSIQLDADTGLITQATTTADPWHNAATEFADADTAVLGCNATSESYWIVTWDGQDWTDVTTMEARRITHWRDLPAAPVPTAITESDTTPTAKPELVTP